MSSTNQWLGVADTILDYYCQAYGDQSLCAPVSIGGLAELTQEHHNTTIEFEKASAESLSKQGILGQLIRQEPNSSGEELVKIVVADLPTEELSYCYCRFIQAKELSHIWLDSEEAMVKRPSTLIDEMVLSEFSSDLRPTNEIAYESERVTKLMSAEILFPDKLRASYKKQIEDNEISILEVARKFMIPAVIVDVVLSDQYTENIKKIRNNKK